MCFNHTLLAEYKKIFVIAVDKKVEAENWNKADNSPRILHIILLSPQSITKFQILQLKVIYENFSF